MINKFNKMSFTDIEKFLIEFLAKYPHHKGLLKTFRKLDDVALIITRYAIERHIFYCKKLDIDYGIDAIREIIFDAKNGLNFAKENEHNKTLVFPTNFKGFYQPNLARRKGAKDTI